MQKNQRSLSAWVFAAVASTVSPGVWAQPEVRLPEADAPLVLDAGDRRIKVALVTGGLVAPWDIEFLPGGSTMLVTESPGALRIVENGRLNPEPVWEVPEAGGNDTLHGVVAHPGFADNGLVYVSYIKDGDAGQTLAITRGRLESGRLVDVAEIFVADAWENARNGIGGSMIFGDDGMLYVTVGDRDPVALVMTDDARARMRAQDLGDHAGTTLRLTGDGGVPDDNPFVGQPGARPEIFTYGHRNGHGLAFHPETGELWQLEIGPLGGDEINVLAAGANYGWPLVSTGRNYTGSPVSDQPWYRPGMENPRMFWVPAISPSGMTFYTGDRFPDWQGHLFIGALSGQQVQRIAFDQPGQAEQRTSLLTELGVRFRDIEQGPDGYLYACTEIRYGSTAPEGTIVRIEPAE